MSCLYTLEINPLSVASFANIFSRSEGCLFVLFMISFAVQKLLSLIRSHLFIFVFIFITLGGGSFQKDTCTPMFIAALFTIARTWKQPKCPSTDEWIKKMWYIYTIEYYSDIKRNEMGSFVEMWMDLESVIQSEVSQKEKNKYRILTHTCGL